MRHHLQDPPSAPGWLLRVSDFLAFVQHLWQCAISPCKLQIKRCRLYIQVQVTGAARSRRVPFRQRSGSAAEFDGTLDTAEGIDWGARSYCPTELKRHAPGTSAVQSARELRGDSLPASGVRSAAGFCDRGALRPTPPPIGPTGRSSRIRLFDPGPTKRGGVPRSWPSSSVTPSGTPDLPFPDACRQSAGKNMRAQVDGENRGDP